MVLSECLLYGNASHHIGGFHLSSQVKHIKLQSHLAIANLNSFLYLWLKLSISN